MVTWKKNLNLIEDNGKENNFKNSVLDLLLKNENITQFELADALCVNPKTLRNYIKEPNSIPLNICDRLCNLFNIEFNELFTLNKCDFAKVNPEFFIDELFQQKINELKTIRTSYMDAFDFFPDIKSKGFELNKKTILDQIHKPLITMIGTKESDVNNFCSMLLQEFDYSIKLPIYYVEKNDLPETMRISERLVVKAKEEEPFDIFLLHDESYRNKITFEPFDPEKQYTEDCIEIIISEAKILYNCIILILPNLIFEEVDRKTQLQTKVKQLAQISIYYLIKFISFSDIILYFETRFKFLSVERTQLISYLIDNSKMRYGQSQLLFVETKNKIEDILRFNENKIKDFNDVLNNYISASNKKQFYDGAFSYRYYDSSVIPDSEILNCIEHLCLDFHDVINLKKSLVDKINIYIQNLSTNYFYIKDKIEMKQYLQNIASNIDSQDNEINSTEEQKQEQLGILNKNLEELEDINTLMGIMSDKINDKSEMLNNIQTLSKNILHDSYSRNFGIRRLAIQLIFNNILIPYFLLEMSFSGGDNRLWAKKIQEEIFKFKESSFCSKIESLLSTGGVYE